MLYKTAEIIFCVLTGENILVNSHFGRWEKILLQLQLNKIQSPSQSEPERKEIQRASANVSVRSLSRFLTHAYRTRCSEVLNSDVKSSSTNHLSKLLNVLLNFFQSINGKRKFIKSLVCSQSVNIANILQTIKKFMQSARETSFCRA